MEVPQNSPHRILSVDTSTVYLVCMHFWGPWRPPCLGHPQIRVIGDSWVSTTVALEPGMYFGSMGSYQDDCLIT